MTGRVCVFLSLLYAQLAHALSLNDVCDALRLWSTPLRALRGATPPSRNNLSHANKTCGHALAESLFWQTLGHLEHSFVGFVRGRPAGMAHRFRRTIHVVDATVIPLMASCLDRAKHRRRKAAAKCHLRLHLRSLLPACMVRLGQGARPAPARTTLRGPARRRDHALRQGLLRLLLLLVADPARSVFRHPRQGQPQLPRGKAPAQAQGSAHPQGRAHRAEKPGLTAPLSRSTGLVTAFVELDGEEREMFFLANNATWSAGSVAELYRCSWQIEVFFKQIKQTLQLADFLGHNANAVKWQLWMALLVYVLLPSSAY